MVESKKSFVLYTDLISVVEKLVVKDRENKTNYAGELFLHILQYVNDKEPIPIDFIIEMAFEPIKNQLKRDLEKYETVKERRREAGRKGGIKSGENRVKQSEANEAIASKTKQSEANEAVNVNDNVNDNVILLEKETKEKKIKKEFPLEKFSEEETDELTTEFGERKKVAQKKERFRPPSIQEVQEYCNERQNGIQAFKFVNFYQSKGWKVGNQSMKDWKAAVRTWEQKNKENGNHQSTINGNSGNQNNGNKVSGTKEILSGARYTEFT